jgi:hypothetical protein
MNNNPALPGGLLESKPTWLNTFGCSTTSAFFVLGGKRRLVEGDSPITEENARVPNQTDGAGFKEDMQC